MKDLSFTPPGGLMSAWITSRIPARRTGLAAAMAAGLLLLGLFAGAREARADTYLTYVGGDGGVPFIQPCPGGQNLAGFEVRRGEWIDAVRVVCAVSYGPISTSPLVFTTGGLMPGWHGGPGGHIEPLVCPPRTPIVIGMRVTAAGRDTITAEDMKLFCGPASTTQPIAPPPPLAQRYLNDRGYFVLNCPAGEVAVGIHGRSGEWLDAIGLICDAPRIDTSVVRAQGRVRGGASPGRSQLTICEAAQKARARNSPAAPGLEAKCVESQVIDLPPSNLPPGSAPPPPRPLIDLAALHARGAQIANDDRDAGELRDQMREGPARRGFEIGLAAAEGQTAPGPGKDAIRDSLAPSERDGFTTAVNFSLSHNRQAITDSAGRGRSIARQDLLAWELREEQPDEEARLGFDIGMAAAEGHTAPGPGKDARRDALPAAQRAGYQAAVTFSVDRNKNAELAAKGAEIARQDRLTGAARAAEADAMRRLGFDIATAIFGDPALGARGNTASGPGSLGVRDGLSFFAQRGFSSAMSFHLSRDYRR
jgi:hypothetical protein